MRVETLTSRDNPLFVKVRKLLRDPGAYRKLGCVWLEGDHLGAAWRARGGTGGEAVFTEQAVTSYAGYANLEYDLTEQLTAQGGIRYTRNIRDFQGCGYDGDGTTYLSFNVLTELFTGRTK